MSTLHKNVNMWVNEILENNKLKLNVVIVFSNYQCKFHVLIKGIKCNILIKLITLC